MTAMAMGPLSEPCRSAKLEPPSAFSDDNEALAPTVVVAAAGSPDEKFPDIGAFNPST